MNLGGVLGRVLWEELGKVWEMNMTKIQWYACVDFSKN